MTFKLGFHVYHYLLLFIRYIKLFENFNKLKFLTIRDNIVIINMNRHLTIYEGNSWIFFYTLFPLFTQRFII